MTYDTRKADRIRAKRLKLQKEKAAVSQEVVEESVMETPEEVKTPSRTLSTDGLTEEELRELADRQRELINKNSPIEVSQGAINATGNVANAAVATGAVAVGVASAVTFGAAAALLGMFGKPSKKRKGYDYKASFGSSRGPWRT